MAQALKWMLPQHARASVAHHRLGLFSAVALIAMHRAFCARGFRFAKAAALQPRVSIIQELLALTAQAVHRMVVITAENADHRGDGFPFSRQPPVPESFSHLHRAGKGQARCHRFNCRSHHAIFAQSILDILIQIKVWRVAPLPILVSLGGCWLFDLLLPNV